jgi:hypothetical protein
MFNMDDFENIKKPSEREEAPDYMIEDHDFLNQMMTIARIIKETDFSSHESRASFIMHMINMSVDNPDEIHEKSLDVVSALSSHICMMMMTINGGKETYLSGYDNSVIQPMIDDGPNIPIWDN